MAVANGFLVGDDEALGLLIRAALVARIGFPESASVPLAAARERAEVIDLAYRAHATALVRMARIFVDDRNAAEDLVQEAFIRLDRSLHRIEDREKVAAYLRSTVLNLARDHNRRGLVSLRHRETLLAEEVLPPDDFDRRVEILDVVEALRELPLRQRDAIVLRYYVDLPLADVAGTLGVSENTAKTHISRGLAALRGVLGSGG